MLRNAWRGGVFLTPLQQTVLFRIISVTRDGFLNLPKRALRYTYKNNRNHILCEEFFFKKKTVSFKRAIRGFSCDTNDIISPRWITKTAQFFQTPEPCIRQVSIYFYKHTHEEISYICAYKRRKSLFDTLPNQSFVSIVLSYFLHWKYHAASASRVKWKYFCYSIVSINYLIVCCPWFNFFLNDFQDFFAKQQKSEKESKNKEYSNQGQRAATRSRTETVCLNFYFQQVLSV